MKRNKSSWVEQIEESFPAMIKHLLKQLKSKNNKVKVSAMKTFAELATMQTDLEKYLPQLICHIQQSLTDGNNDLITYSLSILKQFFRNVDPSHISI